MLVVVLPYLGVFIYLIAQGQHMAERKATADAGRPGRSSMTTSRPSPLPAGAAAEIDKAKQLLDSGAITQAEFDAIKAKALA